MSIKLQGIHVNMLHIGMKKKSPKSELYCTCKINYCITIFFWQKVLHSSKHDEKIPM